MGGIVRLSNRGIAKVGNQRYVIQRQFQEITNELIAVVEDLEEIKNRGFFQRLFRNNTRDLAVAVERIANIQNHTLTFVMGLIRLHAQNVRMLEFLREQVDETRRQLGLCLSSNEEQNATLASFAETLDTLTDAIDERIEEARARRMDRAANHGSGRGIAIAIVVGMTLAALIIGLLLK